MEEGPRVEPRINTVVHSSSIYNHPHINSRFQRSKTASACQQGSQRSHVLPGEVRDVRQVHLVRLRPPCRLRALADPRGPALCLPRLARSDPGQRQDGCWRRRRRRRGVSLVHLLVRDHVMRARLPSGGSTDGAEASRRSLDFFVRCGVISFIME
jgi:hypothetical protein